MSQNIRYLTQSCWTEMVKREEIFRIRNCLNSIRIQPYLVKSC